MFKMSKKSKITLFVVFIMVAVISAPSKEEKKAQVIKEIETIEKSIVNLDKLNVSDNLHAYTTLASYYPSNKVYTSKQTEYQHLSNIEMICCSKSRELDKLSLKNPNTYGGESNRFNKWLSKKEFITSSSFKGKNSYNVEFSFNSQYKCTITENGNVEIKNMFMNQI